MRRRIKIMLALSVCVFLTLACAIAAPGVNIPVPSLTPNMTMTAVYQSGILGSLTPASEVKSIPTTTSVPETTATPVPSETSSPSPVPPTLTSTTVPSLTPTVSPPPTLTPKSRLPSRPGTQIAAAYFATPPTLDGNWDDWVTPEYLVTAVTYGAGNWVNSTDLQSSFRIGWDMNHLYIAAYVRDDVYAQNASGNDLYKGDSLEILLDTDLAVDYYYDVLSPDDYQLGISPGRGSINGPKEAYLWFPKYLQGGRGDIQVFSMQEPDGYLVEAAVPWSVFNATPIAGARYGFAFSVSDNDNTTANLQQSMISSAANRHLTRPMTWGELFLNP